MDRIHFVWELLSHKGDATNYPDSARPELTALMTDTPKRVLELGCHKGAMGAAIKQRFPGVHYTGIEINPDTAAIARTRLDEVLCEDLLTLDTDTHPAFAEKFDALMLADVLEHLYDPWAMLVKLGRHLAPGGKVYASIPNARNYWLISELIQGRWTYQTAGLLDVTHIRFFTLRECQRMFAETGYQAEKIVSVRDPRVNLDGQFKAPVTLMDKWFSLHDVDQQTAMELATMQFLFVLGRPGAGGAA